MSTMGPLFFDLLTAIVHYSCLENLNQDEKTGKRGRKRRRRQGRQGRRGREGRGTRKEGDIFFEKNGWKSKV